MLADLDPVLLRRVGFVLLALSVLLSILVVTRLDRGGRLLDPARERFVLGVPWGTLIVVLGVLAVYFVAQGGGKDGGPIVAGFRSWSYWYPQGMLFSSFAHASESHVTGNLFGTLAFAPLAEYAWGHYPRKRGSESFDSWRTNPYARIALFVMLVILVGVLGSLFVPGAVIGFSGVVFAFAGFAVVTMPIATIVAMLAIGVVRLVWNALESPLIVAQAQPRFVSPSWADVALQGHTYGFLVGVLLAVLLLRYRNQWPRVRYVWLAAIIFAVSRSMWAIYWFAGSDRWILYRAIGTAAVFVLASLIAIAVIQKDRTLVSRIDLSLREVAIGLLLAIVLALALAAIPYNLVTVSPGEDVEDGLQVQDYTIAYVDGGEDQYISSVEIPFLRDSFSVEVSGVIVASEQRNAWEVAVSSNRLAFEGQRTIPVGDATWRETVVVNRTAWEFIDGNTTYKVFARQEGQSRIQLHSADPAFSHVRLNDSRVAIYPSDEFYDLVVFRNETVVDADQVPGRGESVTLGGITFDREENDLVARHDGTKIRLAEYRLSERN